MKFRSFRLRIALLSATLAGSALIGFGAISWLQIYDAKISRLDAELISQLIRAARSSKPDRWQRYADSLPYVLGIDDKTPIALLVRDANGKTLYQSNSLPADTEIDQLLVQRLQLAPLPPAPPPETSRGLPSPSPHPFSPPRFVMQQTQLETWRMVAAKFPSVQVAIAVSLQAVNQEMATIRSIFLISIPGMLLLVAAGAWFVSADALRPVQQLTSVIQRVTVKGLDQRIPVGTTDVEFVELIRVFNQMLERLERSFTQASRFSADAAHELKTPLTILQGELERMLQQVESGSEVQQRLSNLLDEVRRLSGIMRKLLLLSLADAGQMTLYRSEVDLSSLLVEMLEDIELLAPHLEIQTEIAPDLRVQGDRDLLIQVLQNLLSNAIKYNLPNGWIRIMASRQAAPAEMVAITISNCSKEIPRHDRERIFERFHRGDPARTRRIEGIGLGLSLAREIARAHQGDLVLAPTSPRQTGFTLTLPSS
jgi:heavy metal sensor kinase